MTNLRQAAQHALKVMDDHMYRADTHEFYEAKEALRAALDEPQTTHWEGCEAVHPECRATPRKPLTDDEIKAALVSVDSETKRLPLGFRDFARAIERKHGIGEQHE